MGCCGKLGVSFESCNCGCPSCVGCGQPSGLNPCPSIYNTLYDPLLKINTAWNVPQCGGSTFIYADPQPQAVVGSNLWHPTFGYYEIISVDIARGRLQIKATCAGGPPIAAGTMVPACTGFIVTNNPLPPGQFLDVFLASDFIAPAIGDCVQVEFTTTTGLVSGMTIGIGPYNYTLSSIAGNLGIICNDGGGFPPGTNVQAQDSFGRYIYQIQILNVSLGNSQNIVTTIGVFDPGATPGPITVSGSTVTLETLNPFAPYIFYGSIIGNYSGRSINPALNPYTLRFTLDLDGATLGQFPTVIEHTYDNIDDAFFGAMSIRRNFVIPVTGLTPVTITPTFTTEVLAPDSGDFLGRFQMVFTYVGVPA